MTERIERASTFDPTHSARFWRAGTPDWSVYPCHPAGTWERALVFASAGYRPDRADLEALEQWSNASATQRRDYLRRATATKQAITSAAMTCLEPGEVIATRPLAKRIAALDGMPGYHRVSEHLRALSPTSAFGGSTANPRGNGGVYRIFLPEVGTGGAHYFGTSREAVRALAQLHHRRARIAQQEHLTGRGVVFPASA